MSFFEIIQWIRDALRSVAEAITGSVRPPPRRRPHARRPSHPDIRTADPRPPPRDAPHGPQPGREEPGAPTGRRAGEAVSPAPPAPAFSLWPDATAEEAASWTLYLRLGAEEGDDAPVPDAADRLPITQHDEIVLLQAVERGFAFHPEGRQTLRAFLWHAAVARARQAAEAASAPDEGEVSRSRAVNRALLAAPVFAGEARRLAEQTDPGLDLSEIETSPLTVAACWCLLAGAVRRDPMAAQAAAGALQADLKTLLDRCGSLGETRRALEPIFAALAEDPDLSPSYGATVLRLRRREVEARFS